MGSLLVAVGLDRMVLAPAPRPLLRCSADAGLGAALIFSLAVDTVLRHCSNMSVVARVPRIRL